MVPNQGRESPEGSFRAHHVGALAHHVFLQYQESDMGQSLTVFPHSVYLRTLDGELLNLTTKTVKSPININITGDGSLRRRVNPRQTAHTANGTCYVDRLCVTVEDAEIYDPKLRVVKQVTPDFEELSRDLLSGAFQTGVLSSGQRALHQCGSIYHTFTQFLRKATQSLKRLDMEAFNEAALQIVGLGPGFTPAGDDLIAGFLGVFNTFAPALRCEPVILSPPMLARTTWASGKLLDYMQRGLFDEEFGAVVDALVSPDGHALVDALQYLASRGHTSGLDLCSGAIVGAATVLDLAFSRELTAKVIARLCDPNS